MPIVFEVFTGSFVIGSTPKFVFLIGLISYLDALVSLYRPQETAYSDERSILFSPFHRGNLSL